MTSPTPPTGRVLNQADEDRSRMAAGVWLNTPAGSPAQAQAASAAVVPAADQVFAPPQTPPTGEMPPAGEMPPEAQLFERSQIVARVGTEVILYGEISLGVPEIRARYKDRMSPSELERQIEAMLRSRLKPHIETKLVYLDAKRTIPPDGLKNFEKRVGEEFERSQVGVIMKGMKANSREDLETKLLALNSSLEQQKRVFVQQMIAHQWIKQQVKADEEVTYDEIVAYYREHPSEFEHPAQARWRQLMVRFSRFSDKADAYRAIAEMGNQVLGGKDFGEVAKAGSDGPTAGSGGERDWTSEGSLVSESLDKALFTLPVNQLSPILEDEQGFHIIRVIERKEARRTTLGEAQTEIRKKVREGREKGQEEAYLAKLWEKTPVWTAFDAAPDDVRVSSRPQPPAGTSQTSRGGWPR